MNKSVTIFLGVATGAFFALVAFTKAGRKLRKSILKKADELKESMIFDIEKKARYIHDSEVLYN
ncbi:MAG: hypothetical protein IH947_01865 [Bacteroidetes bacterium]|nr:hypothetical protein [Bacteroidota bacterium]MCH8231101.1 hypothetical protein [Bacteroidota bacterium]